MHSLCPLSRLLLRSILLAAIVLSIHPPQVKGYRHIQTRKRSQGPPPTALDSDSELLRALEFLENYERAKSREESSNALSGMYDGLGADAAFEPYAMQNENIPSSLNAGSGLPRGRMPWYGRQEEVGDNDLDMEDLFPPQPEDLESNDVAFMKAVVDEYHAYEGRRQRKLVEKILGDVMAEKLIEQDEREAIETLAQERDQEQEGVQDLVAMLDASSSASSAQGEGEIGLYDPEEIQLSMFSASSVAEQEPNASEEDSASSVIIQGVPEIVDDSFFLSEAGIEALDVAERILTEGGYDDDGSSAPAEAPSSSVADFDDNDDDQSSDVTSLVQDSADLESSASEVTSDEVKEEALKDVIYRIVEEHLRRKLVESMDSQLNDNDVPTDSSISESEVGPDEEQMTSSESENDGKYDHLLDNLVDEIRDQVDKLSSKIMRQIEGGKTDSAEDEDDEDDNDDQDNTSSSSSSESDPREVFTNPYMIGGASSSVGLFNDQFLGDASSSLPDGLVDDGVSSVIEAGIDASSSAASSVGEEEEAATMSDVDLLNAFRDISQGFKSNSCPVLNYLVDDCSVIDGFKGLGSEGYREAFNRPCNRHQVCYICSKSYDIPTMLCDEIYKAELLTLCNGDSDCKQRAKYFWLAAANDRTPPPVSLSLCSDSCVLDFLLRD